MLKKILKIIKWIVIVLFVGFVILVIVRTVHLFDVDKTNAQVAKIHGTKLQLNDVLGTNLPPDPGANAATTVQGIDANKNNIRDDVELAVFKEYPNSAKTRAVLLQYALALQMEVTQPVVNEVTGTEVVREQSRGFQCVGKILVRDDGNEKIMEQYFKDADKLRSFVKDRQLNTADRKDQRDDFLKHVRSYSDLEDGCDIDYSTLPN